jgi:hypothetical protein
MMVTAGSLFAEEPHRGPAQCYRQPHGKPELFMPAWLIIQLVSIASMPAVYDMARDRGRSTRAWLCIALIIGPLALLALLLLGRPRANTDSASFPMPSQFRHPVEQLLTYKSGTLRTFGDAMGKRGLPTWGGTMDKIERSFVAAAAVSFAVLVVSTVLLVVM